jgi:hypothetical protein
MDLRAIRPADHSVIRGDEQICAACLGTCHMKRIQPAKSNALKLPGAPGYGLRHFHPAPHQSHQAL